VNAIGFRRGSIAQVQVAPTFCEKQIDHTFWKSLLLGQFTSQTEGLRIAGATHRHRSPVSTFNMHTPKDALIQDHSP
jgi:hypothetical protein